MLTIPLSNGISMPALGLGTWKSSDDDVERAVREALEVGYRHIDCASIYGNEAAVGRALGAAFRAGDVSRDQVWITTKLWNDSHDPEHVRPALERSLGDLGLDYLDLYLMHWPIAMKHGIRRPTSPSDILPPEAIPIESTWDAMTALPATGLSRAVGVSNFSLAKIHRLHASLGRAPAVNQVEMHPLLQQPRLVEGCRVLGVALTAYSPLGSRDSAPIFGRRDDVILLEHPTVLDIAQRHGATPAQVLIAWSLARQIAVIPKSTHSERIRENFAAQSLVLTDDDRIALGWLDRHHRYIDGNGFFKGTAHTYESLWDEPATTAFERRDTERLIPLPPLRDPV